MIRLLLGLLLAVSGFAAGDFTADGTTNANMDRVKIDNTTPFSLTTAHTLASWVRHPTAGVGQVHFARQTSGTARNYRHATSATNQGSAQASSGGSGTAGYSFNFGTAGLITNGGWHAATLLFASATDATGHVDTTTANDATVAAADDPTAKVYFGAEQLTNEDEFTATTDHRGYLDAVRIYSRRLAAPEAQALRVVNFRPSRVSPSGLEGYWPMRGIPGSNMGTVPDWSNSNRSPGTAGGSTLPTYAVSFVRGIR